jgi:hypothetical protein
MPRHDAERGPSGGPVHNPHQGDQLDQEDLALQRNSVRDLLDSFAGIEIAGGCDDCDAHQTIERLDIGVYVNHVHHDDTCPWWIRYQAATT